MTLKRAEQLVIELEAMLKEFQVEIVGDYNFKTDRYEKAVSAFKPLAGFGGKVKFEGNGVKGSNCLIVSSMSVREFKKQLKEAVLILREIQNQEKEDSIPKIEVRDRFTIEREIAVLEETMTELPVFLDKTGKRKKYVKLNRIEADLMDKAVQEQADNLNKRKLLRAELLCITHRRAVEIVQEESSGSVYLLLENVTTDNGYYTVYDVGTTPEHDYVDQMTSKEWLEFKDELEDAVTYEVAR